MTIITASTSLNEQGTITVEIPIGLLHRAQCARSDYGDYGSGDAEHDTLGEFVDLTVTAAGIPGTGEWTLTAPITNPAAITASSLWTIAAAVPSDLGDTLEFQAQKGGGRYLLVGSVRDQPFGVAAAAARELAAAVAAHLGEPVALSVAAARADAAGAAFVRVSS